MNPEKLNVPQTPKEVVIDHDDIHDAHQRMVEAMKKRLSRPSPDDFFPDTHISEELERTPDAHKAQNDFETLKNTLQQLGIDIYSKRVLEIGSGVGHFLVVLKKEKVDAVGIDPNPREYRLDRTGDAGIIHAPVEALRPEKTGFFGVVYAKDVFDADRYKFQDYAAMLHHIDSVLEKDGVFVKEGEGRFTEEDIPGGWELVVGTRSMYGTQVYRKS